MARILTSMQIVLIVAVHASGIQAQDRVKLSAEQRERALKAIKASESFTAKDADKRVLCEVVAHKKTEGDNPSVIVTTYHYDYRHGTTVKSVTNLSSGEVRSSILENYTPPLAPEERVRALQIALEKIPEVRPLYDGVQEPKISFLPFQVVDKDHQLFRHRIVEIQFVVKTDDDTKHASVLVDLTNGKIVENHETTDETISANQGADTREPETEVANAATITIEQLFPLNSVPANKETGWRVTFGTEYLGAGQILFIKEAHFRRTKDDSWFKVLGDCRLAEMFVPYNDGFARYYDITAVGGALEKLHDNDFGPRCLGTPKRYLDDKVAVEFHDGRMLWADHYRPTPQHSLRGEEMHVWSMLPTGNYAYLMLYSFCSDGSVGFYVAATAHNLVDTKDDTLATHLHMGCWRLNVVLGDQATNSIETVRFKSTPAMGAKAETVVSAFNGGKEGGIAWTPDDLLRLRIKNKLAVNNHDPSANLSYELVPNIRHGNGRTYGSGESWTHSDLWVTLPTDPDGAVRDRFRELPEYVKTPRELDNEAAVIWCKAAIVHRARDEDFGKTGYNRGEGVALTSWTGFNLTPRNFFAQTPLYK